MERNSCIKIVCNLTGMKMGIYEDYYNKKIQQYGSEENLKKYYIQNKIITMIRRGRSIEDLAALFGFKLDESKRDYYNELIEFHNKDNKSMIKQTVKKESKTTFVETDASVKDLINRWKNGNNS